MLSAAAALGIGYLVVDRDSLPCHQQERSQQNSADEDTPRRLDAAAADDDTRFGGGHDHVVLVDHPRCRNFVNAAVAPPMIPASFAAADRKSVC